MQNRLREITGRGADSQAIIRAVEGNVLRRAGTLDPTAIAERLNVVNARREDLFRRQARSPDPAEREELARAI